MVQQQTANKWPSVRGVVIVACAFYAIAALVTFVVHFIPLGKDHSYSFAGFSCMSCGLIWQFAGAPPKPRWALWCTLAVLSSFTALLISPHLSLARDIGGTALISGFYAALTYIANKLKIRLDERKARPVQ